MKRTKEPQQFLDRILIWIKTDNHVNDDDGKINIQITRLIQVALDNHQFNTVNVQSNDIKTQCGIKIEPSINDMPQTNIIVHYKPIKSIAQVHEQFEAIIKRNTLRVSWVPN